MLQLNLNYSLPVPPPSPPQVKTIPVPPTVVHEHYGTTRVVPVPLLLPSAKATRRIEHTLSMKADDGCKRTASDTTP